MELRRNSVQDAERLLWACLALGGGAKAEFSFRLDRTKTLAGKVASSPFFGYDIEVIYMERWVSYIGYCLLITQFTDQQHDKIQQSDYIYILPKMGFNRHFPRAVIFGPLKFQGISNIQATW